jgi:hypothetical protein
MEKHEIIAHLKRKYPDAVKIEQDEFKNWSVMLSDLDGWLETYHTFAVRGTKFVFLGTTTCEY